MKRAENLNVPSFNGLVIAAGFGVLAFAVAKVVGGFDYTTSGFFGALVFAVAAAFLCIPWGAKSRIPATGAHVAHDGAGDAPAPAAAAAAAPAAPSAAPAAAPAAVAAAAPVAAAPAAASADVAVMEAPAAKPAAKAKAEAAAPAVAGEGVKPKALKAPRKGQADDLKQIEGIGPVLEKLCHELGIYHFDQIAAWGADEVAWMDANLKGFRGRVTRDRWVAQAKLIGEVGMEEFLRRAKSNDY
ncbi:MAG: hypothetical protein RIR62_2749 [Pseudomonadota bacterium]|jgi:NADH-quinone oxidoreductase subunit E